MLATTLQDFLQPPVLFVIGLGILAWVVVRMRKQARRMPPSTIIRQTENVRDVRAVAQEVEHLIVELHETARDIAVKIENRTTKLNVLLEEADAKIQQLEALRAEFRHLQGTVDAAPPEPDGHPMPPLPPARMEDPKYHRIYDLFDRGHTPREIAQQIGAQPGEIELILNLRGQHTTHA